MWGLSNTWANPGGPTGQQQGFPAPGSGAQYTGAGPGHDGGGETIWSPLNPSKGRRSWFRPASKRSLQQGFAPPENAAQMRPPGSMPNKPPVFGTNIQVWTPYFSRGAAAFVQNYGKVLTNPIGAGIVVTSRPSASYGESATYENGALWWTSQIIPTSINLSSLTDAQSLEALVGSINVQAMVPTTG